MLFLCIGILIGLLPLLSWLGILIFLEFRKSSYFRVTSVEYYKPDQFLVYVEYSGSYAKGAQTRKYYQDGTDWRSENGDKVNPFIRSLLSEASKRQRFLDRLKE